ncbi:MAG: hypothetical protein ACRDJE_25255 [Dehalococcoidia bacterium]
MTARIVSLRFDAAGTPFLAQGSPHAYGPARARLAEAIRPDVGAMRIEPAPRVHRQIPPEEPYPHPETCAPFQDANGLGFVLRPRLPLLFVKNRRGELLPDARTALAYARENDREFAGVLETVAGYAAEVLDPEVVRRYEADAPRLFRDLAQPYRTFGHGFFAIPAGLYAITEPGTGTVIGPPLNRALILPVQSGLVETDWHHHALFVVTAAPRFEGRSLLITPREVVAQVYVVAYRQTAEAAVQHSRSDRGGQPAYEARWGALSEQLAVDGRGVIATRAGIASVTLDCLHCRISVTRAADGELPHDHALEAEFVRPYKRMQRQHRRNNHE